MAKRVNKRFLIILTAVVLIGGVGGMAAMKLAPMVFKKSTAEREREAERLEKLGKIDEAAFELGSAVHADRKNAQLLVRLGDFFDRNVTFDPQNLYKSNQAWQSALGVDPACKPALERLLEAHWAFMQALPVANSFSSVRDTATRMLELDPQHRVAQARLKMVTIREAQGNIPSATPAEVEKSVKALREMAKQDPSNAELPFFALQGELYLGMEAAKQGDTDEAQQVIDRVEPAMVEMCRGQETNAAMQLRAAQLYMFLAPFYSVVQQRGIGTTKPTTFPADQPAGKYTDRITAALDAAAKNIKVPERKAYAQNLPQYYKDAQFYVELVLTRFDWLENLSPKAPDDRNKMLEDLVEKLGEEPSVRLAYARNFRLDSKRREKTMELLARPVIMDGITGVEALRRMDMQTSLKYELGLLRLASIETVTDAAKRKQVLDAVDQDVRELESVARTGGQSPQMMELKGRLRLQQGNLAEGIELLQQAVDRRGDNFNFESMLMLANAYMASGQTGQARKLLESVATRVPDFKPARIQWIQALISDGATDKAREQLAELEKRFPDSKEIPALRATIEGGKTREDYIKDLPEETIPQRLRKVVVLRAEGKNDEAIALAESVFKEDPKNLSAIEELIEMYVAAGRPDDAEAFTKKAIEANPDNAGLKQALDQVSQYLAIKRTPAELEKWRLDQIKNEKDPVSRELQLHQFYMAKSGEAAQRGDNEELNRQAAVAEQHLIAAEKLKPDDISILSRRFEFLLRQQRFDEAGGAVLQKLSAANADEVNGQLLRLRLAMAKKDYGAAEVAARDITRKRAQFAQGWTYLGLVLQAQGRHREAITAFTNALERQGRNHDALKGLIDSNYALDDTGAAREAIERARTTFPKDVGFREVWLNHELNYGDPFLVIKEREDLLRKNLKDPIASLVLAETYLKTLGLVSDPAKIEATVKKARGLLEAGMIDFPGDIRFLWPLAQVMAAQEQFLDGEKLLKDYAKRPEVTDKAKVDLYLAEFYIKADKPALAEQSYRDALAKTQGSPDIKQKLAALQAQTNRVDEAIKTLDGVPGPLAARHRAQLLAAAKRPDEAQKVLREAVAANPNSPELSNGLIDMLLTQGQFGEVEQMVRQRLARNDADEAARYYGAVLKLRRKPADIPGALREATAVAERNPRAFNVQLLLAEIHDASGDRSSAIDDLVRALQLAPLNRDLRLQLIDWCSDAGRWNDVRRFASEAAANPRLAKDPLWPQALAKMYAATGNVPEAKKQIAKARSLVRPDRAADFARVELSILQQAKSYADVLKLSDSLIAKGGKQYWLYQFRGLAKVGLKDKTADKDFDTALASLDPEKQYSECRSIIYAIAGATGPDAAVQRIEKMNVNGPRWRLLAAELYIAKDNGKAALDQLLPLEPEADKLSIEQRGQFYRSLGQAYHMMRPRPDLKAVDAYKKYLALDRSDALAFNNLAYLLAEEISPPQLQDAKTYSKQAYELASAWKAGDAKGRILDTYGWVLVLNGGKDLDTGIQILEEAIEEFPLLEAHYHLGEAHLRKKRGEEAEDQLNRAIAMLEKLKKEKGDYDQALEPRIQRALEQAKALNGSPAAAAASAPR